MLITEELMRKVIRELLIEAIKKRRNISQMILSNEISEEDLERVIGGGLDKLNADLPSSKFSKYEDIFQEWLLKSINEGHHHGYIEVVNTIKEFDANYSGIRSSSILSEKQKNILNKPSATIDNLFDILEKYFSSKEDIVLDDSSRHEALGIYPIKADFRVEGQYEKFIEAVRERGETYMVVYPLTTKGSIHWTGCNITGAKESYKSGEGGKGIGKVTWCTSVKRAGGNYFDYYASNNVHIYYCVGDLPMSDPLRKISVGFKKLRNGYTEPETSACVDINNNVLSESQILNEIGSNAYNAIMADLDSRFLTGVNEQIKHDDLSSFVKRLKRMPRTSLVREKNLYNDSRFVKVNQKILDYLNFESESKQIMNRFFDEINTDILYKYGNFQVGFTKEKIAKTISYVIQKIISTSSSVPVKTDTYMPRYSGLQYIARDIIAEDLSAQDQDGFTKVSYDYSKKDLKSIDTSMYQDKIDNILLYLDDFVEEYKSRLVPKFTSSDVDLMKRNISKNISVDSINHSIRTLKSRGELSYNFYNCLEYNYVTESIFPEISREKVEEYGLPLDEDSKYLGTDIVEYDYSKKSDSYFIAIKKLGILQGTVYYNSGIYNFCPSYTRENIVKIANVIYKIMSDERVISTQEILGMRGEDIVAYPGSLSADDIFYNFVI